MQTLLTEEFLAPYYKKVDVFPTLMSRVVYLSKYCRNSEGWTNTIKRAVLGNIMEDKTVSREEAEKLFHLFWTMQGLPPGRGLWVGGVDNLPVEGRYNCYYVTIRGVSDWGWAMGMLMVGGGVGVGLQDIHLLPSVKRSDTAKFYVSCRDTHPDIQLVKPDAVVPLDVIKLIVEDSREGWVWGLEKTIEYAFEGKSIAIDVSRVRERGAPLKTFGGYASGPSALVEMLRLIYNIIRGAEGRKLSSVEGLDITNLIGKCVKAGSVRRSAIIQLGEFTDIEFRNAKKDYEKLMSHRHTSNNSIVFREYSEMERFNWVDLVEDNVNYGEPGFLNLAKARETDPLVEGVNPCQPAWATVLTPQGIRTIGDIGKGDLIWSGSQWTKVVNKWSTGIKQVNAYRTRAGIFYGTENHRVVSNRKKVEVRFAESIDVSVMSVQENRIKEFNKQAVMDGLVLGDGTTHKATGRTFLVIGRDDSSYFKSEVAELIKEEATTFKPGWWNVETNIKYLPNTYQRQVPEMYFHGSFLDVCSFLRGLYSANGSVCASRVQLKTSSFGVIEAVQAMLSSIGIPSYYTTNKPKSVTINNGVYECKESYDLNIGTRQGRLLFSKFIGFIQPYKNDALMRLIEDFSLENTSMKVTYDIVDIEEIGEEEVFDLTVEADEHTYWTGGLLVSNCGEQTLEHRESCNLAEVFPARFDGSLDEKTVFKLITRYCIRQRIAPVRDAVADAVRVKNNRIGVGLGGICDFRYSANQLSRWYSYCREEANNYASYLHMRRPQTVTTVKPSGTLSLLVGSSPGIHADYDEFYIRRMTLGPDEPMTEALISAGVPYEQSIYDRTGRDLSFMFPSKLMSPMGITKKTQSVTEQLERQLLVQQHWADNAVSSTIEFNADKDEMISLAEALKKYAPQLKSVSLLSRGHSYPQAPYESVDEATYVKMASKINSNHPLTLEGAGTDYASFEEECKNGVCPTR